MGHLFEDHPELAVPQSEVRSMKSEHEELCRRIAVDAVDSFGDAITAIRELSAEVERLKHDLKRSAETNAELATRAEKAEAERDALQAKVDALMLEYCPDEMTPEQIAEWERHQRAAEFKGE